MTEIYYCPMAGDRADHEGRPIRRTRPPVILIPGKRLPPGTSDETAEHERAMMRCGEKWTREPDGSVIIWVEM